MDRSRRHSNNGSRRYGNGGSRRHSNGPPNRNVIVKQSSYQGAFTVTKIKPKKQKKQKKGSYSQNSFNAGMMPTDQHDNVTSTALDVKHELFDDSQVNSVSNDQTGITSAMRDVKHELATASQANSNVVKQESIAEESSQNLAQQMQKLLEEKDAEINQLTQGLDSANKKAQKLEKDIEDSNTGIQHYKECYGRIKDAMQLEIKAKDDVNHRIAELKKELAKKAKELYDVKFGQDTWSQEPQMATNLRTSPSHNVTGIDEYLFASQNFPQHQLPRNRVDFNVGHGNRLSNITGIDEYLFSSQNFHQNHLPPDPVDFDVGHGVGSPNNLNMNSSRQGQERSSSQSRSNVDQRNSSFK